MITLILYLVVLPVVWVAVGGACAGVAVSLSNDYIEPQTRVWMVVLAPITFIVLMGCLAYRSAIRAVQYLDGAE